MIRLFALLCAVIAPASNPRADDGDQTIRDVAARVIASSEKVTNVEDRAYILSRSASILHGLGDRDEAMATWEKAAAIVEALPLSTALYNNHMLTWIAREQIKNREPVAAGVNLSKVLVLSRAWKDHYPRTFLLHEVADLFEKAGDAQGARKTRVESETLKDESTDQFLVANRKAETLQVKALSEMIRTKNLRGAVTLLPEVQVQQGQSFDGFQSGWLYAIAEAAGPNDADVLDRATKLARGLKDLDANQALQALVRAYLRIGKRGEAFAAAKAVDTNTHEEHGRFQRIESLLLVGHADYEAGDRKSLDRAIAAAREDARAFATVDKRHRAMLMLAHTQAEIGDFAGLALTLAEVPESMRIGPLLELGDAMAKAGKAENARAAYVEALAIAEAAPKDVPPADDADIALTDPALAVRMRASRDGIRAQSVATIKLRLGDAKGAEAIIDALPDSVDKRFRIAHLARLIGEGGRTESALRWIDGIDDAKARSDALLGLADGLVERRKAAKK